MLFNVGPVAFDTEPFNADKFVRTTGADIAKKSTVGGLKPKEHMGEGDEIIKLSGQLLPAKIGGLTELEAIDDLRLSGVPQPVVRGDGKSYGWFLIERGQETHKELMANGVGFIVTYSVTMTKSEPDVAAPSVVQSIYSLFDVLGS